MAKTPRHRTPRTTAPQEATTDTSTTPASTPAAGASASVDDDDGGTRITLTLTPDGGVGTMRGKTREKLRKVLPFLVKDLGGVDGASVASADAPIDPAVTGMLYGALGSVLVAAASRLGYPSDEAIKMQFSPEERAQLAEPTAKVLNKYSGNLGKYQDEIILIVALGSTVAGKASTMKKPGKVIPMPVNTPSEGSEASES